MEHQSNEDIDSLIAPDPEEGTSSPKNEPIEVDDMTKRIARLPRIPRVQNQGPREEITIEDEPPQLQINPMAVATGGASYQAPHQGRVQPVNFQEKKIRVRDLVHSLFPTFNEAITCMANTGRFIPCSDFNQGNSCQLVPGHNSDRVKGKREGHFCEICYFAADLNNPHAATNCKLEEFLMRKSIEMAHSHALSSLKAAWQSPQTPERGRGRGGRANYRGKCPRGFGKRVRYPKQ